MRKMYNDNRGHVPRANGFISAILGLLMFLSVSVFVLLLVVRTINTVSVIQDADIVGILEREGMSHFVVDQVNRLPFAENEIEIEDVDEFIRNEAVAQELTRALEDYFEAFAEGNPYHHITHDEVLHIARSLAPELSEMLGHHMTESDYEHLSSMLDSFVDFSAFSVGNIADVANVDMRIPQIVIAGNLINIAGILCFAALLLMVLHHKRKLSDTFKNAGIPVMLSGILCFLLGFIVRSYTQIFGAAFQTISDLLNGPAGLLMIYSLYTAGLGLALVIIYIICKATRPRAV